jgi:polyphosphate:AMP phosphotransferase
MFEAAEVGNRVSKKVFDRQEGRLRVDLLNAQFDLQKADFSVVVLIVGDDRIGCNEVVNLLHEWMDARYMDTRVFGAQTEEERQRPPLWRVWRALPPKGRVGLLVGGVGQPIAARLRGDIDDETLDRRLERLARMMRDLVEDGTLVLKFWLHLPKKEHRRRLKAAKKHPAAHWRVDETEWEIYEAYDRARPIAERFLRKTNSADAPWHVVESTDRHYRDLTVTRTLLTALQGRFRASGRAAKGKAARPLSAPDIPDLDPNTTVLAGVDLSKTLSKKDYDRQLNTLQARLRKLSLKARDKGVSSVLAFEGWDAAGKGGAIRRVTNALDAADYRVVQIAAPTDEEAAHHYLWRFWRHLPPAGTMLIFDRSWYGRVLVERVEGFAALPTWKRAYDEINDFEEGLVDHGIPVIKFWLHISREEQMRRFRDRAKTPYKKYKITAEDYRNRRKWNAYVEAVDEMIVRTSTEFSPWHLVPAEDKRIARIQVLETACDAVKRAIKNR